MNYTCSRLRSQKSVEVTEAVINDHVAPGCVRVFTGAKEWVAKLICCCELGIKAHVGKCRWGWEENQA